MTNFFTRPKARMLIIFWAVLLPQLASAQYSLVGNSVQTDPQCFELTPNLPTQSGAVWNLNILDLSQPFDIHARLFFGCDDNGADGMAFVLQPVSTTIGSGGGGLGYQGITPSLAVEFDTYQNTGFGDPVADHIALMRNGDNNHTGANNLAGPVNLLATGGNIEDCAFHTFRFVWNPAVNQFRVFVDCQLRLTYVGNIITNVFNGNPNVFWGFTASTGALSNRHEVCLDFVSFIDGQRDTFLCEGQAVPWTLTPGVTYAWTPAAGVSNPAAQSVVLSPTVSTLYTANVTDACGFVRVHQVDVLVQPQPVFTLGPDTTICPGDSVQLVASGGQFYQWDPDPSLSDTLAAAPFARPATATDYTVTVSSALGCEARDTIRVALFTPPSPTLTLSSQAVCTGDPVLAEASGGMAYQWSPAPLIATFVGDSALFLPINLSGLPADTTWLVVTAIDAQGCRGVDSAFVIARPLPNISAGPDRAICIGDTTQLSVQNAQVFVWDPSPFLSDTLAAEPFAYPPATATFTVTGADLFGCVNTAQVTISVQPLPIAFAGNDTSVCLGETVPLQASGGSVYFWDTDSTLSDLTVANPFASPVGQTIYAVTVADALGCEARDSVTVSVIPPPVTSAAATPAEACAGAPMVLLATGGVTYAWTSPGALNRNDSASVTAIFSASGFTPDTIWSTVIVRDAIGCVATDSVAVIVRPGPPLILSPDPSICIGDSVRLTAEGSAAYEWTPSQGLAPGPVQMVRPALTTTYIVTGTDAFGCQTTDSLVVTVNPLPQVNAGKDTAFCRNDILTLSASGALLYEWSPPAAVSNPFSATPQVTTEASTLFVVAGRDANGCINRDSVFVQVFREAAIRGELTDSICVNGIAALSALATAPAGAITYRWSTGETTPEITVSPANSTDYWVVGFAGGCPSDTLRGSVFVSPRMTGLGFLPSPVEGFAPLEVSFTNTSTEGVSFEWDFGDGSTGTGRSPQHTYLQFGRQTVTMVAVNALGCRDTIAFEFIDVWPPELYFPSAFSPNGDLINDEYFISMRGMASLDARIYDRWGLEVFASTDQEFRWDGTYKGRDVPEGVYVLVIKATDTQDRVFVRKWPITLIR